MWSLMFLVSMGKSSPPPPTQLLLNCFFFLTQRMRDDGEGCAYDQQSSSIIRLNNSTVLYLREVNR